VHDQQPATTPAHGGNVDVVVHHAGRAAGTGADAFTYEAAPSSLERVAGAGPARGLHHDTITVTPADDHRRERVAGPTRPTWTVVDDKPRSPPSHAGRRVGAADVVVTTAVSTTLTDLAFTYTEKPPTSTRASSAGGTRDSRR